MVVAVTDPDGDRRREALARVAQSGDADADWAIEGFATIALLDSDAQARCVAIRALERSADARAIDPLHKILDHRRLPATVVRPPSDPVRADATLALSRLSEQRVVPEADRARVAAVLLERLRGDSDRHVRAAAARGVACYPSNEAVEALIAAMRDADFAVVFACEDALVKLTGATHHCVAAEWERWLEANRAAPLAGAGNLPESRRPPYTNPIGEAGYKFKRFWRTIFPPSKDQN